MAGTISSQMGMKSSRCEHLREAKVISCREVRLCVADSETQQYFGTDMGLERNKASTQWKTGCLLIGKNGYGLT